MRSPDRNIAVLIRKPPVSFAPRDLAVRFCLHCARRFTPSSTLQTCCSFLCATGGRV